MVFPDAAGVGLCDAIGTLTWKDGKSYQYTSGKPHAATAWGSSVTLRYDANGLEETKAWSVISLVAFHGVSWAAVLSAEKVLRSGLALEKRKPSEGEGSGGSISCRAREISE